MDRQPCENNYPCVHGICKLTIINTTICFCDFPYSGETCNTTALFWATTLVLIFSVTMILIVLNRAFGSELKKMSQISNLSPSSSFYSSTSSFEDCPQITTQIDELHQVNSTIREDAKQQLLRIGTIRDSKSTWLKNNFICPVLYTDRQINNNIILLTTSYWQPS